MQNKTTEIFNREKVTKTRSKYLTVRKDKERNRFNWKR